MSEADVQPKSHAFQAEVSKILHLMVHSVYSEKEVFLRELISNASDACDKLRYEALTNADLSEAGGDYRIEIAADKETRTLRITDNGIGMDAEELIDNLGTIARSGTGKFVEQLSGDATEDSQLIGQFGVGFYSAFMVAEKVEVLSCKAGTSQANFWRSNGEGEFEVEPAPDTGPLLNDHGTQIILYLREGEDDFLEPLRLRTIVKSYSDHISIPIHILEDGDEASDEPVNVASALWRRPKSEITEDQYKEFYHHVGHVFDEPAVTIHYKAEGRHEYDVLLFVPNDRPMDLFDPNRETRVKTLCQSGFLSLMMAQFAAGPILRFVPRYCRFRGHASQYQPRNAAKQSHRQLYS